MYNIVGFPELYLFFLISNYGLNNHFYCICGALGNLKVVTNFIVVNTEICKLIFLDLMIA